MAIIVLHGNWNVKLDQHLSRREDNNDIPSQIYKVRPNGNVISLLLYQSNGHYGYGENSSYISMAHFVHVYSPQIMYSECLCISTLLCKKNMLKSRKCFNLEWKELVTLKQLLQQAASINKRYIFRLLYLSFISNCPVFHHCLFNEEVKMKCKKNKHSCLTIMLALFSLLSVKYCVVMGNRLKNKLCCGKVAQ